MMPVVWPRTAWCGVLVMLFGSMAGSLFAAPADQYEREAPYEVVAFSTTHVRVDIGSDKSRAQSLQRATILTEAGPVPATLVRARRTCTWLCGKEEGATCHYEAILRVSALPSKPLAVLAGHPTVANVTALAAGPEQPIGPEQRWLDATPFSGWPGEDAVRDGDAGGEADEPRLVYRWTRFPDGVFMARSDPAGRSLYGAGRAFYSPAIALAGCTQSAIGPFTLLACGDEAELLYEGSQPLLFSVADYSTARTRPTLRFTLDGKDAVLVRLGLKAEEVAALLVRDGSRWRLAVRGADYPTLC